MAPSGQEILNNPRPARIRRPIRLHRNSCRALAALLITSAFLWAGPAPSIHLRNFGKVDDHLFRGGVPSNAALEELRERGVKLVIDLREKGGDTLRERQEVTALGMHYVSLPLSPWSAPTQDQVRNVLSLLGSQPTFVHCWRGKDRTGTIIACYRMQYDGWSNTRALEEANHYGMSHMERAMRSFILHFAPAAVAVPSPYSAAPPPLATHP